MISPYLAVGVALALSLLGGFAGLFLLHHVDEEHHDRFRALKFAMAWWVVGAWYTPPLVTLVLLMGLI